jgi:hypothetical protein
MIVSISSSWCAVWLISLQRARVTLNRLFALLTHQRDPLFFATDLKLLQVVSGMLGVSEPAVARAPAEHQWQQIVSITDPGRAVLRGDRDWLALNPPARWVGGVEVRPGRPNWRWDEVGQRPIPQGPLRSDAAMRRG